MLGFYVGRDGGNDAGQSSRGQRYDVKSLTELIQGIYPIALDCGISPFSFWEYSIDEITDLIASYKRREEKYIKDKLVFNQVLSFQIAQEIIPVLIEHPEDFKKKQLWDFFPDLFNEEKHTFETIEQENEFERFKEKRRQFASQYRKGE